MPVKPKEGPQSAEAEVGYFGYARKHLLARFGPLRASYMGLAA